MLGALLLLHAHAEPERLTLESTPDQRTAIARARAKSKDWLYLDLTEEQQRRLTEAGAQAVTWVTLRLPPQREAMSGAVNVAIAATTDERFEVELGNLSAATLHPRVSRALLEARQGSGPEVGLICSWTLDPDAATRAEAALFGLGRSLYGHDQVTLDGDWSSVRVQSGLPYEETTARRRLVGTQLYAWFANFAPTPPWLETSGPLEGRLTWPDAAMKTDDSETVVVAPTLVANGAEYLAQWTALAYRDGRLVEQVTIPVHPGPRTGHALLRQLGPRGDGSCLPVHRAWSMELAHESGTPEWQTSTCTPNLARSVFRAAPPPASRPLKPVDPTTISGCAGAASSDATLTAVVPNRVVASSTLAPTDRYGASNVVDGDMSTAWVEGVQGAGIGQGLVFLFDEPVRIDAIKILGGYAKSRSLFHSNNRVQRAAVTFVTPEAFDARSCRLGPSEDAVLLTGRASFGEPLLWDVSGRSCTKRGAAPPTRAVVVRLDAVDSGSQFDDTAISEVRFFRVDP